MTPEVALVVVSHSGNLAKGVVEVAGQMAPDVTILPAGGTDEDEIGTSYTRVKDMVDRARTGGGGVVLLGDLGSALMLADTVAEDYDGDVVVVDVPFVEGTVAAAVAAQGGEDVAGVTRAARTALEAPPQQPTGGPGEGEEEDPDALTRTLTLSNTLGLHARPAAIVARIVAEHEAKVTINGVDAASVLALMGMALPGGARVHLRASGAQAEEAMEALVPHFEDGFGEE